jgi:hypothetical protein
MHLNQATHQSSSTKLPKASAQIISSAKIRKKPAPPGDYATDTHLPLANSVLPQTSNPQHASLSLAMPSCIFPTHTSPKSLQAKNCGSTTGPTKASSFSTASQATQPTCQPPMLAHKRGSLTKLQAQAKHNTSPLPPQNSSIAAKLDGPAQRQPRVSPRAEKTQVALKFRSSKVSPLSSKVNSVSTTVGGSSTKGVSCEARQDSNWIYKAALDDLALNEQIKFGQSQAFKV